ncbi:MAG: TadC [Thermoleophilia bacterium]|nr:TadC [Thermoleophilia bacterium]
MILLILGLLAVSGGVFLALENASLSRRQVQTNLRRAAAYATVESENRELQKGIRERLLTPLFQRFSTLAARMSPAGKRMELGRKIRAAGSNVKPQTLMAFKGAFVCAAAVVIVLGAGAGSFPLIMIGLVLFIVGFMGADFWLNGKVSRRRDAMERMLPDTLDLLTVSVEAGLGFDAAVMKVCEKMKGPLIEEFDVMAREIRVGETRRQALRNMGERVESNDIKSFARSIIQADEMGTSLGRTLKVQAQDMRVHRQLSAEEKAMKAPVKMLFPTVMFIFPAMFLVILGPAMLNILEAFKNT